jgi:hypothetical protein
MSKQEPSTDWNLVLIASSPDGPERVLRFLSGAVSACGGWVLSHGSSGEECAEIDFEFPRANCVEIYSVLVATGVTLSQEAHMQLTELCQCTSYLLETKAYDVVRLHLTIYTRAAEAWSTEEADEVKREAA